MSVATYSIFTFDVIRIPCNRLTAQYSIQLIAQASKCAFYSVIVVLRVSAPPVLQILFVRYSTNTSTQPRDITHLE
jgi:hypothetical protein